jgi:threonine synthase
VPATPGLALEAVRASLGSMIAVDEREIGAAVAALSSQASVTAEPAGAVALAGLRTARAAGLVRASEEVLLLVTGRQKAALGTGAHGTSHVIEGSLDEVAACLGIPAERVR